MKKKGFTLVEIIVSISLVSVVVIFLFQIITTIKNIYNKQNNRNEIKISTLIITREVEKDLNSFGLNGSLNDSVNTNCGTLNSNIVPNSASEVKCVKLIYNSNNVKFNEGYIVYYKNHDKYFLGYKRGKDNIIETQTVREISVGPSGNASINIKNDVNLYSLKINIPIRDNNDNYDLVINYMGGF